MSWNPFKTYLVLPLTEISGLDEGNCKILTCLFLSFPISAIFKRLPDQKLNLKNYYIIFISAIYIFLILEIWSGFFVLLFNALFTYILTKYYRSQLMPWVNLIVLMLLLAVNHLKSQFTRVTYDPTAIDITGAQMVLVMKLSAFAWSYSDGMLYHKDITKFNKYFNTYQKSRAVLKHPSFVSFMGYVFFYASIVTGPSFDYADYEKFILTDIFNDVPDSKKPGRKVKRKIPRSGRIALWKVIQGILWAALWIAIKQKITTSYTLSDEFIYHKNFIYRLGFLWILGFVYRLKYYTVWSISEAGCILAGLGYNGYDAKKDKLYWNRVQNIDPYAFETGQNVHDCLEAWNMNTNKWLKNFIYLRTCKRDPETGKVKVGMIPTLITFFTSAFWHGSMPGYYMTFIIGAFMQAVGKIFRRNFRPLFASKDNSNVSPYKFLYDIVCWVVTQASFGYAVQPFVLLELKPSFQTWKANYFWVHIACFSVIIFFDMPIGKKFSKFLAKYHLQPKTQVTPISQSLAALKESFDSTADLHEAVKVLPDFDNQIELQDQNISMPPLGNLSQDFVKLKGEFDEWLSTSSKDGATIDQSEIDAFKAALSGLDNDVKYYISKLDEFNKSNKKE
ncbi:hypothetical protein CANARDRAFT_9106 [[Candida] arabinofermentans NRRL YB-2248]|uniref:Uncharacterized protein n=1 Tax=[Candida] arabinofermentans NRRL YB-2248 TaxID=983967 RepID=A0A1E4SWE3_9ASCO|nr:hypothetical protein CANARDRAFT_9106 [[Candida] arabinofermentans NRRL YB-2248]